MSEELDRLPSFRTVLLGKIRLIRAVYKGQAGPKLGIPQYIFRDWFRNWPSAKYLDLIDKHYLVCREIAYAQRVSDHGRYARKQERRAIAGEPSNYEPVMYNWKTGKTIFAAEASEQPGQYITRGINDFLIPE